MAKPIDYPALTDSQEQAFWKHVNKQAGGCWEWTGAVSASGYGYFGVNYRSLRVHKASWVIAHGRNPDNLVCHTCDNRRCVRPDHLFDGTGDDNLKDAKRKGRTSSGIKHSVAVMPNRPRGETHANAILNDSIVREIRRNHHLGQRGISKAFGISKYCAWSVLSGKTWSHVV